MGRCRYFALVLVFSFLVGFYKVGSGIRYQFLIGYRFGFSVNQPMSISYNAINPEVINNNCM